MTVGTKSSIKFENCTVDHSTIVSGNAACIESNNSSLDIKDSVFRNFNSTAIFASNSIIPRINIENCLFENGGTHDLEGGAIYIENTSSIKLDFDKSFFQIRIKNVKFSAVHGKLGGGVYLLGSGFNDVTVNIKDSTFTDCLAKSGSAVYAKNVQILVSNCIFEENTTRYFYLESDNLLSYDLSELIKLVQY